MGESISENVRRVGEFFMSLTPARRVSVVVVFFSVIASLVLLFGWASKANFVVLNSKLTAEDSTQIIRYLRDKKIPFKVDKSGSSVMVPHDNVYDLRLELAAKGMAQTGVVGYEIFDHQEFGTTSTVQRINHQRAIEGELIRTINHIKGVDRTRVHLALPQKSAFLTESKEPTASVVLDLVSGFVPASTQVRGIQNLVASAVERLQPENVTILSTTGKQLSTNLRDPAARFAAVTLDYRRNFESELEQKVIGILSRIVGEGNVVAKITANLDFSQVSETQTLFDADNSTPRSVNVTGDTMNGNRPIPSGKPGVKSQVPGADGTLAQAEQQLSVTNSTTRSRSVTNFEVPQTTRVSQKPVATLKSLSVAVMIDGQYEKVDEKRGPASFKAWSPEKLAEFKVLVANAVGWTKARDPEIEIRTMKFFKEDINAANAAAMEKERFQTTILIAGWICIGLLFTLFFVFVVRPFIKWTTENTIDNVEDFLPQTLEELEKAQTETMPGMEDLLPEMEERVDPVKVQGEMVREKILSLVSEDPLKAAQIVHEWIHLKLDEKDDEAG